MGLTKQGLRKRAQRHWIQSRKGSNLRFHRALKKHGFDNFTWETHLQGLSWEEACSAETDLIEKLGSFDPVLGYNMTKGGEGSLGVSVTLSSEARSKISSTLKEWHASGNPEAEALRAKISKLRKETSVSLETRKNLAKALTGRRLSQKSCEKISASKMAYPEELRKEAVSYAEEHSYRAAERHFGIPRQTIRRWSKTREERAPELAKMRERNRVKHYACCYVFPFVGSPDIDSD